MENPIAIQRCEFTTQVCDELVAGCTWKQLGALGISLSDGSVDAEIPLHDGHIQRLTVLGVPSLRAQLASSTDDIDVHADFADPERHGIPEALGFAGYSMPCIPGRQKAHLVTPEEEPLHTYPMRRGGDSLVFALNLAGSFLRNRPRQSVLIVGAERLSDMPTRELVRSAGKSICPEYLYGRTLITEVPLTLISAYALKESANGLNQNALSEIRSQNGPVMSGNIHTAEIAGANDGAIALLVGKAREGIDNVYLASAATTPASPMSWLEVPATRNFAADSASRLKLPFGMNLSDIHVENYDCFFIAVLLQAAAVLKVELDNENLPRILDFCRKWDQLSTLKEWASWGISSAKKIKRILEKMSTKDMEIAGIFGNGGVCDSVSAAILTTNVDLARTLSASKDSFTIQNPDGWQPLRLISDPETLDGATGEIDMIAFQTPIRKKDGTLVQEGTTFVRIVLDDRVSCVLTNLAEAGQQNSIFADLSGVGIGQKVTLKKYGDTIRAEI